MIDILTLLKYIMTGDNELLRLFKPGNIARGSVDIRENDPNCNNYMRLDYRFHQYDNYRSKISMNFHPLHSNNLRFIFVSTLTKEKLYVSDVAIFEGQERIKIIRLNYDVKNILYEVTKIIINDEDIYDKARNRELLCIIANILKLLWH